MDEERFVTFVFAAYHGGKETGKGISRPEVV